MQVTYFFIFAIVFFKKIWPTPASFCLFPVFSNKQYIFYNKSMWKMSIQYTVPGFNPTTLHKWVVTHNH